jgi:hypothetical protein
MMGHVTLKIIAKKKESVQHGTHAFRKSCTNRKGLSMKHFLFIIMAIVFAVSAEAADVGVSVSIGQPGFYGQIDIGNFPRPQVIYSRPVVIVHPHEGMAPPPPVYIHVPPGHEKNWKKHCHKYNACNRPVYFVRNQWYNNTYVPEYQARHGHKDGGHGDYRGGGNNDQGNHGRHDKGHDKGKHKD